MTDDVKQSTLEEMRAMEMNAVIELDNNTSIRRVPGGWMYVNLKAWGSALSMHSIFVPMIGGD